MGIKDRLVHAWDVFTSKPELDPGNGYGGGLAYGNRDPSRARMSFGNERSIVASIYTRMAIDASTMEIKHIREDDQGRYLEDMPSYLNDCLSFEANIDQASQHLHRDFFLTLFDKGVAAVVPVDTTLNPNVTGGFDVKNIRIGEIVTWFKDQVTISVWNEKTGRRQEITVDKKIVGIVQNPFSSVMNEPSSTLQRLIRKLNLLDAVDEQAASGKLDIIIQLPYVVKGETKRTQAEQRRKDMEFQLAGSKYGVAYADGTEKITQLNRPAENNLMKSIEFLTTMLYSQLGITAGVMDGTADESTMLNYMNRTIGPLLDAYVQGMRRAFLTKTARTQGQNIRYFRDPFKLVPISQIAEIADKFARNEVMTSNEIRQAIGMKPSSDPQADKLQNSNMPKPAPPSESAQPTDPQNQEGDSQNGS